MAFRTEISLRLPFSVVVTGALSPSKKSLRCIQCAIPDGGVYLGVLGRPFGLPQSVNRPFLSRDIGKLLISKVNGSGAANKIAANPPGFPFPHIAEITPFRHHAIIYALHSELSHRARSANPRSEFVSGRDVSSTK